MATIARQVEARWGDLLQAIFEEIGAFEAEYAREPFARSFWGQVAVEPPREPSADAVDPARTRRRWLDLWGTLADRIGEREAEHVRSAPGDAPWALLAGAFLRARLLEFPKKLRVQHPDQHPGRVAERARQPAHGGDPRPDRARVACQCPPWTRRTQRTRRTKHRLEVRTFVAPECRRATRGGRDRARDADSEVRRDS